MDYFLCELFDVPSTKDIADLNNLFSGASLVYSSVYKHPAILRGIVLSKVFQTLFGIDMPKPLIYDLRAVVSLDLDTQSIINGIITSTFAKYIISAQVKTIQANLPTYIERLKSDETFVKDELWKKLDGRFGGEFIIYQSSSTTLFKAWSNAMAKHGAPDAYYDAQKSIPHVNPFCGTTLENMLSTHPSTHPPFKALSATEVISTIASKDHYFMSLICGGTVVIDATNATSDHGDSSFIFTVLEALDEAVPSNVQLVLFKHKNAEPRLLPCNVVVFEYESLLQLFTCLPKNMNTCVYIGDVSPPAVITNHAIWITKNNITDNGNSGWRKLVRGLGEKNETKTEFGKPFILPHDDPHLTKHILSHHFKQSQQQSPASTNYLYFLDGLVSYMALAAIGPLSFRPSPLKRNPQRCVLCIDNRKNYMNIVTTLVTFKNLEPDTWGFVFIGSTESVKYMKEMLTFDEDEKNAVFFFIDPRLDMPRFNINTYNDILKDQSTWSLIQDAGFEKCLIIQDDAVLFRPGIEKTFLRYDYVGAPWMPCQYNYDNIGPHLVGNGGLSLRSVDLSLRVCLEATSQEKRSLFNKNLMIKPEDVFFIQKMRKMGGNIPDFDEAVKFAMEECESLTALGVHKFWVYLPASTIKAYMQGVIKDIA